MMAGQCFIRITLTNSLAYPGELIGRSLMIIPFMWIFCGNKKLFRRVSFLTYISHDPAHGVTRNP